MVFGVRQLNYTSRIWLRQTLVAMVTKIFDFQHLVYASRSSSRNFSSRCAMYTFWKARPKKIWEREKTSKIQRDLWQLSNLISHICGTDWRVEHLKKFVHLQLLPRWAKKWRTLVHKQKKFYWLILTNPSGHFSGDYISAITGCCPSNFYTR